MGSRPPTGRPTRRLFIALWPGAQLRRAIDTESARWAWPRQAARVPAEKLHVTLHFLGEIEAARIESLQAALRKVPSERFVLRLDTATVWSNGVALLGASELPAALARLHAALADALLAWGVQPERRPYKAHVTLARRAHAATPLQPLRALEWRVSEFALVDSERAPARYLVLERYRASRTSATASAPKSLRPR